MAFESFPNTPHNNRAISLVEHEQLAAPLGLSGLTNYGTGTTPVYADSTGRQVKLRAGVGALIRGTRFNNLTETALAVAANASGNPRVDLVVLRLNRADYQITPVVLPGTPGANPVAPTPVRNEPGGNPDYYDQPLAEITVPNAATTITATQVTNRAWWITGSGYTGYSTARPPIVGGVLWRETDTGISYIGSHGGTWQRIYQHTGWVDVNPGTGWNSIIFSAARDGNLCTATICIQRTGGTIGSDTPFFFGPLPGELRPDRTVWGTYHATQPSRSYRVCVTEGGTVRFQHDGTNPVVNGATITASLPPWIAATI